MDIKTILAAFFAVLCVAIPGGQIFSAANSAVELTIDSSGYEQTAVADYIAFSSEAEEETPLSEEEIELIALVTMAEVEGESEKVQRLVIDTILNRVDSEHFPNTVNDVIWQPKHFTVMWNGRAERCEVRDDICSLVKEELKERTNSDVIFFRSSHYSEYGEPLFKEGSVYFSSYN